MINLNDRKLIRCFCFYCEYLLREPTVLIFDRLRRQIREFQNMHYHDNDWENKHDNYVLILNEQKSEL